MSDDQRIRITGKDARIFRILQWLWIVVVLIFFSITTAHALFDVRLVPRTVEWILVILMGTAALVEFIFWTRVRRRLKGGAG